MPQDIDDLFEEALFHLQNQDMSQAKACIRAMKSIDPAHSKTIEILGDYAREDGDYKTAKSFYTELTRDKDPNSQGRGCLSLGYLYLEMLNRPIALKWLEDAIPLLNDPERPYDKMQAMATIGEIQYDLGNYDDSAQTFQTILEEYENDELDDNCALIYLGCARQLGDALRTLGKLDAAHEQYESVARITKELEVMEEHANALDGLGVLHQLQGDLEQAKKLHLQALKINEDLDGAYGILATLSNLSRVHIHLEDWPKAREYASRLLKLETEGASPAGVGFAELLLAECDLGTRKYNEAEEKLARLQELFSEVNEPDTYINVISVLGKLKRLQGEPKKAEQYQQKALKVSQQINNLDFLLSIYDELAEIRVAQNRFADAREQWLNALPIANELKSAKMIERVKRRLADIENQN